METLIAYTFSHDSVVRAAAGRARVEAYYGDLWNHEAKHQGYDGSTIGLHVWDRHDGHCFWPSWHDTGDLRVASLHTPLGYQRVVGDVSPYDAPGRLAQAVRRTPASFLELAPPFTMAVLDPAEERLELFTDSIGVGRLFQLRLSDGWVWSNRPVAALLFAGVPAMAAHAVGVSLRRAAGSWTTARRTTVCWLCPGRHTSLPTAAVGNGPSAGSRRPVCGRRTVRTRWRRPPRHCRTWRGRWDDCGPADRLSTSVVVATPEWWLRRSWPPVWISS